MSLQEKFLYQQSKFVFIIIFNTIYPSYKNKDEFIDYLNYINEKTDNYDKTDKKSIKMIQALKSVINSIFESIESKYENKDFILDIIDDEEFEPQIIYTGSDILKMQEMTDILVYLEIEADGSLPDKSKKDDINIDFDKNNILIISPGNGNVESFHNDFDLEEFISKLPKNKKKETKKFADLIEKMSKTTNLYEEYVTIPKDKRIQCIETIKLLEKDKHHEIIGLLTSDIPTNIKSDIWDKMKSESKSISTDAKFQVWSNSILKFPWNTYSENVLANVKNPKLFLKKSKEILDDCTYGQEQAKRMFIKLLAQMLKNPSSKGKVIGLHGPPGIGKCHGYNTPILMYNGNIKMVQDIKVGEFLMGDDSKPREVLSLARGKDDMYEVIPNKGDKYTVNKEHILCLKQSGFPNIKFRKNRKSKFQVNYIKNNNRVCKSFDNKEKAYAFLSNHSNNIIEISVKDYLKLSENQKKRLKGYRVGVNFQEKEVEIDPYMIGFWLGDGNSRQPYITTQDSCVIKYFFENLSKYNLYLSYISQYDYKICNVSEVKNTNLFRNTLKKYNLIQNKHIPNDYKCNSKENRLKLLAGLIDSDGSLHNNLSGFDFSNTNEILIDDVIYLCRSLGFACYKKEKKTSWTYKGEKKYGKAFTIHISGEGIEDIPTIIPRKKAKKREQIKNVLNTSIQLKSIGYDNYYGFIIDGNHRYLLHDFSVTHNTKLIKEGISKILKKPFANMSMGGHSDTGSIEGFSYTYEGSKPGKIVDIITKCGVLDPIIYLDEIDKVGKESVINLLMSIVDPEQNNEFQDKYFGNVDIDLSKITWVLSYNNPNNFSYILRDRITEIKLDGYTENEKIVIAKKFLIPDICNELKIDAELNDSTIQNLIRNYTYESGVRKLKQCIYDILSEYNYKHTIKRRKITSNKSKDVITLRTLPKYLIDKEPISPERIHANISIGKINGLYATSASLGGIIPIQLNWFPSDKTLDMKLTGNLGKIMKESTSVSITLAWNYISSEMRNKYQEEWKNGKQGIHIHCSETSMEKEGPSAGTALTVAIVSLLTKTPIRNDIGITGEIDLSGNVLKIGGLRDKLFGAKNAGCSLVLFPESNKENFEKIKKNSPELIDTSFKAIPISTLEEAIEYTLIKNISL